MDHSVDLPNPALGENGRLVPLAISSHVNTHAPAEFCVISAAHTSLLSGDPPIINNLNEFSEVSARLDRAADNLKGRTCHR